MNDSNKINNRKPSNVFLDVKEAKVISDPKRASNGITYFKVACYTGGKGESRQEIVATLFVESECAVEKGNTIEFRGDLSQKAARDPKYGIDTTVNVESYAVLDARKTVDRPKTAPKAVEAADSLQF